MAAPYGNQNAAKAKVWRDAINRALEYWPEVPPCLSVNRGITEAAHEFVRTMMEGKDIAFFRELGDRLDGKPAQAITGDAEADPVQVVGRIELVSLLPK